MDTDETTCTLLGATAEEPALMTDDGLWPDMAVCYLPTVE